MGPHGTDNAWGGQRVSRFIRQQVPPCLLLVAILGILNSKTISVTAGRANQE